MSCVLFISYSCFVDVSVLSEGFVLLFSVEWVGSISWWRVCEAVVHMNGDVCI